MVKFFSHSSKNKVSELADLFDISQDRQETLGQFQQKIKSTLDYYRTSTNIKNKKQSAIQRDEIPKVDINQIIYEVVSYDENLIKDAAKKNLKLKQFTIGTKIDGVKLLISQLAKENPPLTYVDQNGNVWRQKDV
jgi:hypothetical protein